MAAGPLQRFPFFVRGRGRGRGRSMAGAGADRSTGALKAVSVLGPGCFDVTGARAILPEKYAFSRLMSKIYIFIYAVI